MLAIGAPPAGGTQAQASVSAYTLRAVQGATAISGGGGIGGGTVFKVGTSAQCTDIPTITWDGAEFVVSHPGLCQTMPAASYDANERANVTLSAGGSAPVIEPLWGIAAVTVTQGAGYNADIAPDVLATTLANGSIVGHIYTPPHLLAQMAAPIPGKIDVTTPIEAHARMQFDATLSLARVSVANLPSGCTAGDVAFAADARNTGEAAGAGTGALVYCTTAGKWFANGAAVTN